MYKVDEALAGDWEVDLLDPLLLRMQLLGRLIDTRAVVEDHAKIGAEVKEALRLHEEWRKHDVAGTPEGWEVEDERLWKEFWDYLRGHIRGWWD